MDPLVADGFHNQTCSPLCGLPEELLLDIMKLLDPLSIQCLRRACRYHDIEYHQRSIFVPWHLRPLLDRDIGEYCADCRAMRTSPTWNEKLSRLTATYMHCSGCRCDHPVGLFSRGQRRAPPRSRICIGREGFVRLCNHKVVKLAKLGIDPNAMRTTVYLPPCEDPSHIPKHHGPHSIHTLHANIQPTVAVETTIKSNIVVELRWVGHLRLPDLGCDELGHCKRLRKGAAEFIAPELPPGRLTEMSCFDPNRCCCLQYSGLENLSHGWQLTPVEEIRYPTCRAHPDRRLGALQPTKDAGDENPQPQEAQTGSHRAWADNSLGTLIVWTNPCSGGGSCLRVRYCRQINVFPADWRPGCVTMSWFRALDPDSYNLTADDASFGVLWCRQQGCRNYYRYLKPSLVPLDKIIRRCTGSCPASR
ncbi:hypothetical protein QBC33DRAFT_613427 [Phialemonium atrogriseum]|uniref:F-box domain-containing protein n=1 Tax=Phialemonium atrogriseum TaxID=1093897 RepID=A0AAJ0BVV5_9PEZI|nr:uncharacterized protein QBC33DRAFT_613427 [Phialemonium atrogriseum]KAK1764002.1 hypothetical protein QBC33DRAFT_613427 [Phialemonium atrogriseum]